MNEKDQKWLQCIKDVQPIHKEDKRQFRINKIDEDDSCQYRKTIIKSEAILPYLQKDEKRIIHDIEHRQLRKIKKDHHLIEQTIDLHGLNKEQAFKELESFLIRSVQQEYRYVLVITGKGKKKISASFASNEYQGVIRNAFISWIKQGELKKYVTAVSKSHPQKGGEGAFYLQIAKARK